MIKCSKVCWDLIEIVEKQANLIKKLTWQVKELESILGAE